MFQVKEYRVETGEKSKSKSRMCIADIKLCMYVYVCVLGVGKK